MTDLVTPALELVKGALELGFSVDLAGITFSVTLWSLATVGLVYKFVWQPYIGPWTKEVWDAAVKKK